MSESRLPDSLTALRERWNRDRTSRFFLQLADELRRAGELDEAIAVLSEGLEIHSQSVAGLVALGRCQMETGAIAEATESLERALDLDPAQLVANKLITEAWLELGDRPRARMRLEIYRLLNERDHEIETYEERLRQLEEEAIAKALEAEARQSRQSEDSARGSAIFALPRVEAPAPIELAEAAKELPTEKSGVENPFPGLPSRAELERRFRPAVADDSVFALWPTAAGSVPAAASTSAARAIAAEAYSPEPARGGRSQTAAEPEPPAREAAEKSDAADVPETADAEATDAAAAEVAEAVDAADSVDAADVVETEAESAREIRVDSGAGFETGEPAAAIAAEGAGPVEVVAPVEPLFSLASIGAEVESEPLETAAQGASAGPGPADEKRARPEAAVMPAASSTLAALYLQQGHLDEAETEFRSVLGLRPGDPAAIDGLRRVAEARSALEAPAPEALDAASPAVAVDPPGRRPEPPPTGGLTQRRVRALGQMLNRLAQERRRRSGVS